LFGADTTTGLTLKRARDLRVGVLEGLLPAPSASVSVEELVKFKDEHAPALSAFRDRVDAALIDLAAAIDDDDARRERARILRDELIREREEIVAAMKARRWPRIAFGAVAGVVAAAPGVVAPFFIGGGVAAAAVAAPGAIPAAYGAVEALRRPNAGAKPLAYAAFAQRAFAART
jgi:hypothetical protein